MVLPTIAVIYFLLMQLNSYYSILHQQYTQQSIYFGIGIIAATLFYTFRFRFISTTPLLFIALYLFYQGLDTYSSGEFDAFFISVQFLIFVILFSAGWLVGFGFLRLRYFANFISGFLLLASIYVIARTGGFNYIQFAKLFSLVALYSIYMIYTCEQLRNVEIADKAFWKKFILRLIGFIAVASIIITSIILALQNDIEAKIAASSGKGKTKGDATTQQDKDGNTEFKDAMQLSSSNKKDTALVFVAHINNFFEGTTTPNPLYLTYGHYTKFDSISETFEKDSLMPLNDEFNPAPGSIPLFRTYTDSSKLKNVIRNKNRKTVEVEIFNKRLSKNTFLAPSQAFAVQPIAVDKNFNKTYNSSYKTKSYVSNLNSAYFIYNAKDENIKMFQEKRFETLRNSATKINDTAFYNYYTSISHAAKFDKIKALALEIGKNKNTTIDKMLAVRDYFLQKNRLGKQVYKYSDNPGIPGMQSASKLDYFLFESKKGYCAYYAGATLFLLRNMGVPCRVTTGFLTVDRSEKNKGWYWYYADQSHAWVEVYFPEYGWIDFDTTVGNDDANEANSADGTPPIIPEQAVLGITGIVKNIDTIKKIITIIPSDFNFKKQDYKTNNIAIVLDLKNAKIIDDTNFTEIKNIKPNDIISGLSYESKLYNINANSYASIIEKISKPLHIDDLYILSKKNKLAIKKTTNAITTTWNLTSFLGVVIGSLLAMLLIALAIPNIILAYYKWRSNSKNKIANINYTYKYCNFKLNQMGIVRAEQTPYMYALQVDRNLKLNYTSFINIYLKKKFSTEATNEKESNFVLNYINLFNFQLNKNNIKNKFLKTLNIKSAIAYLIK